MSETSNVKRRIGLIASLVFAASMASCAVVPGPYGFPHVIDLTIGSSVHRHHGGHRHWRRGHRRGGHRHHHRRHRHNGH